MNSYISRDAHDEKSAAGGETEAETGRLRRTITRPRLYLDTCLPRSEEHRGTQEGDERRGDKGDSVRQWDSERRLPSVKIY